MFGFLVVPLYRTIRGASKSRLRQAGHVRRAANYVDALTDARFGRAVLSPSGSPDRTALCWCSATSWRP